MSTRSGQFQRRMLAPDSAIWATYLRTLSFLEKPCRWPRWGPRPRGACNGLWSRCWNGPSGAGRRGCPLPGVRGSWHSCASTGGESADRPHPSRSRPRERDCAAPEARSDRGGWRPAGLRLCGAEPLLEERKSSFDVHADLELGRTGGVMARSSRQRRTTQWQLVVSLALASSGLAAMPSAAASAAVARHDKCSLRHTARCSLLPPRRLDPHGERGLWKHQRIA